MSLGGGGNCKKVYAEEAEGLKNVRALICVFEHFGLQ